MASASDFERFDRIFNDYLKPHTNALVLELRVIAATPPSPNAGAIGFCQDADWDRFPVYAYVVDAALRRELVEPWPYESQLLSAVRPLVPDEAIDEDAYEQAGVRTIERGARLLAEWFGECWHKAGGASFPLPAFIHLHDSNRYYDLRAKRWVKELQELSTLAG